MPWIRKDAKRLAAVNGKENRRRQPEQYVGGHRLSDGRGEKHGDQAERGAQGAQGQRPCWTRTPVGVCADDDGEWNRGREDRAKQSRDSAFVDHRIQRAQVKQEIGE